MKFFAALRVHMLMGLAIGGGILLVVARGQWWLLFLVVAVYIAGLYKFGCTARWARHHGVCPARPYVPAGGTEPILPAARTATTPSYAAAS